MDSFTPEPRKALGKLDFTRLAVEQSGMCGNLCGRPLVFEPHQIRDEHLVQLAMGGTNELSNRSLWCNACAKLKDALDAGRRAKVRSLTKSTKKSQKTKAKIPARVGGIPSRPMNQKFKSNTRVDG